MSTSKALTAEMARNLAASSDRRRTLVLHGPAACGKTSVSKKLAKFLGFGRVADDCFEDRKGRLVDSPQWSQVPPYGVLAICGQAHPDYASIGYAEVERLIANGDFK